MTNSATVTPIKPGGDNLDGKPGDLYDEGPSLADLVVRLARVLAAAYHLARPMMSNPMSDAVPMPWGLRTVET